MEKVIAILNKPQSCLFCEFGHSVICAAKHNCMTEKISPEKCEKYNIYDCKLNRTIPDWCPLKPVSKKTNNLDCYDEFDTGYEIGWNRCIEEILKEENDNAESIKKAYAGN